MTRGERKTDPQIEAAKDIYELARREANDEILRLKSEITASKNDGFSLGVIKANKAHRDYTNLLDAIVLYKARKEKSYKKEGLTWEDFCEAAGYARRTAEILIEDVAPVFDAFSANLPVLAGVNVSDIRYLGKTKAAEIAGLDENGYAIIIA